MSIAFATQRQLLLQNFFFFGMLNIFKIAWISTSVVGKAVKLNLNLVELN